MNDQAGLRGLKILTAVMGVLIVAGVAVVGVTIARRMSAATSPAPAAAGLPAGAAAVAPVVFGERVLEEPPGTRIAVIASTGDRLSVHLQGGGPDRIIVLDLRTGAVTGRIALAH